MSVPVSDVCRNVEVDVPRASRREAILLLDLDFESDNVRLNVRSIRISESAIPLINRSTPSPGANNIPILGSSSSSSSPSPSPSPAPSPFNPSPDPVNSIPIPITSLAVLETLNRLFVLLKALYWLFHCLIGDRECECEWELEVELEWMPVKDARREVGAPGEGLAGRDGEGEGDCEGVREGLVSGMGLPDVWP